MSYENLDNLHSGTIADVLDGLGEYGGFPSVIKLLNRPNKLKFFGQAYTVRWAPVRKSADIKALQASTWQQVRNFLVPEVSNHHQVYVAGTDTGSLITEFALAGGLSATDFEKRKFRAMVLGGAIRDAHVIEKLGLPVWSSGYIPADTQGSFKVLETGTWCNVGGQMVQTGDWIFGDETGLIKIPKSSLDKVLKISMDIEDVEDQITQAISTGQNLFDVVEKLGRI